MERQSEILDNVFSNFLGESRIFKNREALRHDYIPNYLPHREEEIRLLGQILGPSLRGMLCSNVLIYGKTGTGKTAGFQPLFEKLEVFTGAGKYLFPIGQFLAVA